MASTYSTNLKIQEIGNGEQSGVWGNTTNTNWELIEQAVAGVQTITMANANYTLTNLNGVLDEARNMVLRVQGTNSGIYQVIIPSNQTKFYVVSNSTTGGYAITIGISGGSVISIPNGTTAQVYTDGTNTYSAQTGSSGDFTINGNLTVTGNETEVGTLSASTLSVSNTATFAVSPTAPTPTAGDNTTKVATTAFVTSATSGLGTMASQNATAVAITGGTINGVTGTASGLTVGNATTATTATTAVNVSGTVAATNGGTGLTSAGASGNVLTSDGTTWQSTAPPAGVKAWVNFNGSGSTTILASYNVTSVTYVSTGLYTVNFTNALIDANYAVSGMSTGPTGVQYFMTIDAATNGATPITKTTSAVQVRNTGAPGNQDGANISIIVVR
jgi:hypothetical protein